MSDFLYLYHVGSVEPSPEQMRDYLPAWMAWMQGLRDKGHIKDAGHPLARAGRVVKARGGAITDGPYAESKDVIGGYSLISAQDIEQAARLAASCPMLQGEGTYVEVRPILPM